MMKELTIATYNILHGQDADLDWSRLAAVIAQSGADMVGLQEVDMGTNRIGGADSMAGLIAATGLPHALFIPAMDFDGGQYGTAILSRYPIATTEVHPLPSAHYEPRAFGCVTVSLEDGTPFVLVNTHLSYESRHQQDVQMAHLAEWIMHHIPRGRAAVVTGDFNTEDHQTFAPMEAVGLTPINRPDRCFKTFRPDPIAIDNILYPPDTMTPVDCGMIDADTSDHNLLWCRFTLS